MKTTDGVATSGEPGPFMLATDEHLARIAFLSSLSPEDMLEELLATIHGDGGHYSDEHGLAKAVADAEARWHTCGVPGLHTDQGEPTADVKGTATPQDQAIYNSMSDRYQRERTLGVKVSHAIGASEGLVLAVKGHLDGWASATFGWQDDPDPAVAERNRAAAIEAHAAECLRRIRETLTYGVTVMPADGAGVRTDGVAIPLEGRKP